MALPGRLTVNLSHDGRVTGPASITHNDPWPCVNGTFGSGAIKGTVMHTMVGDLPGTVQLFNDPSAEVSAHFGIDQEGKIHQFGPIGKGWVAFAEKAGNFMWYSIEHADHGSTENPLTDAQVTASAQLLEMLSAFAGFPLQVTDSVEGTGYGTHVMGGVAWGGHTCPGPGPRAGQRHAIIELAKQIRRGTPPPPPWQAKALADAQAIESGVAGLIALATPAVPASVLATAQGIESELAKLVTLLKNHQ